MFWMDETNGTWCHNYTYTCVLVPLVCSLTCHCQSRFGLFSTEIKIFNSHIVKYCTTASLFEKHNSEISPEKIHKNSVLCFQKVSDCLSNRKVACSRNNNLLFKFVREAQIALLMAFRRVWN